MSPRANEPAADPYVVLGVPRGATAAEIRAAYLALVAQYHPDRHQGNPLADLASARTAEINRAYEQLSRGAPEVAAGASASAGGRRPPGPRPMRRKGPSTSRSLLRGALFLLAFPFLVRLAPRLARLFAGLGRLAFDGAVRLRGTPFVGAGVLLAAALLIFFLVRRHRRSPPRGG